MHGLYRSIDSHHRNNWTYSYTFIKCWSCRQVQIICILWSCSVLFFFVELLFDTHWIKWLKSTHRNETNKIINSKKCRLQKSKRFKDVIHWCRYFLMSKFLPVNSWMSQKLGMKRNDRLNKRNARRKPESIANSGYEYFLIKFFTW